MSRRVGIGILALWMAQVALGQSSPPPEHYFNDRLNLGLFSADLLVRTLDWQSTEHNLGNGWQESSLPKGLAGNSGAMLGYSLGVAGAVHGTAWIAHKTGHHRIERILPMLDITYDGRCVVGNYEVAGRRPPK